MSRQSCRYKCVTFQMIIKHFILFHSNNKLKGVLHHSYCNYKPIIVLHEAKNY